MKKQINNIISGEVLKIKLIKENEVVLLKYPNDSAVINTGVQTVSIPTLNDYILDQAKIVLGADYTASETTYNWLFELRPIRISIPDVEYAKETLAGNEFGQLILTLIGTLKDFVIQGNGTSVVYLEEIYEIHIPIINPHVLDRSVTIEKLENGAVIKVTDLIV